jgi:DNA-binding CsgD family transcriptional regulator
MKNTNDGSLPPLSKREMEVLLLIAEGLKSLQIAGTLFISKQTVDKHRKNMLKKTGAKSSAALVRLYIH